MCNLLHNPITTSPAISHSTDPVNPPSDGSRDACAPLVAQLAPGEEGTYLPVQGGESDDERARAMALELAERAGTGFAGAGKQIDDGRARANALVKRHRAVIDHVADALMARRIMSGDELRRAMQMKPAWYLHDDEPQPTSGRPRGKAATTRGKATDYKPLASDWQDDGRGGFVAKRTFTARIGSEVFEITAGQDHVAEGHALVAGLRAVRPEKSSKRTLGHLAGVDRAL
jgi:hypothetical protein